MDQKVVATNLTPVVILEQVEGELQVKGWERAELVVRAQAENVELQEQEGVIRIRCQDGCIIRLPWGANLKIEHLAGEGRIKRLEGSLVIGQAQDSLYLKEIGPVEIGSVQGNLTAKLVSGDFKAGVVEGNVIIKGIEGDCQLERVEGNLELRSAGGDIAAHVDGNATLTLGFAESSQCNFEVDGNVVCRIPGSADVQVSLSSESENIVARLPERTQSLHQSEFECTLGEGKSQLKITASGNVVLDAQDQVWDESEELRPGVDEEYSGLPADFTQRIAEQVKNQVEAVTRQLNQQMEQLSHTVSKAGLSEEQSQRILHQAQRASERATLQAQEKMRRTQEKLDRKFESMRHNAEARAEAEERRAQARSKRAWGFEWNTPPTPPTPPAPPDAPKPAATDEERLMILRMLEEKKISISEAEKLLAALE